MWTRDDIVGELRELGMGVSLVEEVVYSLELLDLATGTAMMGLTR